MFQVLEVQESGVPGKISHPASWEESVELFWEWLEKKGIKATPENTEYVSQSYCYEFDDGGGIFIVSPEEE